MSGNQTVRRVPSQLMPKGNVSKTLPYVAKTLSGGPDILDLTFALSSGVIDQIQSVFIDNSLGTDVFVITIQSSGMQVKCPAGRQMWVPILVTLPNGGLLTFTGSNALVPVFFMDVPMPVGDWNAALASQSAQWVSTSLTTIAFDSLEAFPEDPLNLRAFVFLKAPETDDLWVNRIGGNADIDGVDCFKIPAGEIYENFAGENVSQQWNVCCATGGLNVTALSQAGPLP